jgi:hypothetical protein
MAIPGKGRPPWLLQVENKETGGVRFGNDFFSILFVGVGMRRDAGQHSILTLKLMDAWVYSYHR